MFGREKPAPPPQPTPSAQQPGRFDSTPSPMGSGGQSAKIETIIGANCRMNGVLQSDGGIRIEGMFEGQIQTAGNLIVAESARVVADVQAYNVVVSGQVKGNVTANRIEITESGKLFGDLNVNTLLLSEGAYLRGQTNMTGDVEAPLIEAPRVSPVRQVSAPVLENGDAD